MRYCKHETTKQRSTFFGPVTACVDCAKIIKDLNGKKAKTRED